MTWWRATIPWLVLALLILAGVYGFRWATEAPLTTASAPIIASSPAPPPTYPAEMLAMANAISTYVAPTPTATPRPPTPTHQPIVSLPYCGMTADIGDLCVWPHPTPTPAPLWPDCRIPTPNEPCIWRGTPVPSLSTEVMR